MTMIPLVEKTSIPKNSHSRPINIPSSLKHLDAHKDVRGKRDVDVPQNKAKQ